MNLKEKLEKRIAEIEMESYEICSRLTSKPIIMVPAGRFSPLIYKELERFGITFAQIGDNDTNKKCIRVRKKEVPVSVLTELLDRYGNDCNYMVVSRNNEEVLIDQLKKKGIREDHIFTAPVYIGDLVSESVFQRRLEIWKNAGEIEKAISNLADEESKNELLEEMSIFAANCPVFRRCPVSEEYFDGKYLEVGKKEVFLDGGMFDGRTSQRFIGLCPDYKAVYGFEANPHNQQRIADNLKEYQNITVFDNALTDRNEELHFHDDGGEGSRLSESGDVLVRGISGDSIGMEPAPTFIKLDIEGAEYQALNGLKETIHENHPKITAAVYHSLEDHWRLINEIKDMEPGYRVALQHHYGYEVMYGTILYAGYEENV